MQTSVDTGRNEARMFTGYFAFAFTSLSFDNVVVSPSLLSKRLFSGLNLCGPPFQHRHTRGGKSARERESERERDREAHGNEREHKGFKKKNRRHRRIGASASPLF